MPRNLAARRALRRPESVQELGQWPGAWGNGMNAVAHEGKVCVFGIEDSPPLALADGVWTGLPSLPDEYCFGYGRKLHNPSANRDPMLGSVPLP